MRFIISKSLVVDLKKILEVSLKILKLIGDVNSFALKRKLISLRKSCYKKLHVSSKFIDNLNLKNILTIRVM